MDKTSFFNLEPKYSPIYNINELKELLYPIFKKYNIYKAILFGSYAKQHATTFSDIDLCVESNLKGLSFFGLLEEVCCALKCPVDLIDTQDIVTNSEISKEINESGVLLYERA